MGAYTGDEAAPIPETQEESALMVQEADSIEVTEATEEADEQPEADAENSDYLSQTSIKYADALSAETPQFIGELASETTERISEEIISQADERKQLTPEVAQRISEKVKAFVGEQEEATAETEVEVDAESKRCSTVKAIERQSSLDRFSETIASSEAVPGEPTRETCESHADLSEMSVAASREL